MGSAILSRKRYVAGAVGALLVLAAVAAFYTAGRARAQLQPDWDFLYSAKFVCVPEVGPAGLALRAGTYRTTINVHNPVSQQYPLTLGKRAVLSDREDAEPGHVGEILLQIVGSYEAFEIDCRDIKERLLDGAAASIGEGFVTILSEEPLEVVAVYTSTARTGGEVGHSIDVEPITCNPAFPCGRE